MIYHLLHFFYWKVFKMGKTRNLSDLLQFCKMVGRGASEGKKIKFHKSEVKKILNQNSNFWVKTICNFSLEI